MEASKNLATIIVEGIESRTVPLLAIAAKLKLGIQDSLE